jgi:hypothetical protein
VTLVACMAVTAVGHGRADPLVGCPFSVDEYRSRPVIRSTAFRRSLRWCLGGGTDNRRHDGSVQDSEPLCATDALIILCEHLICPARWSFTCLALDDWAMISNLLPMSCHKTRPAQERSRPRNGAATTEGGNDGERVAVGRWKRSAPRRCSASSATSMRSYTPTVCFSLMRSSPSSVPGYLSILATAGTFLGGVRPWSTSCEGGKVTPVFERIGRDQCRFNTS